MLSLLRICSALTRVTDQGSCSICDLEWYLTTGQDAIAVIANTVKLVYNDHLMGYFSAF